MTLYNTLYWLVTIAGILGVVAVVVASTSLIRYALSPLCHRRVCTWIDHLTTQRAEYATAERERREAIYSGNPDASSLRRWYGWKFRFRRAAFIQCERVAWCIWHAQKNHATAVRRANR